MTSDTPRSPARRLLLLALLAVFVAGGCGDSGEKKSDAPPAQPAAQPQPKKAPAPGTVKME